MGKRIYVNGNIIVKTQFFMPREMWCGYPDPPGGAIVVEPMDVVDGIPCLLIDDKHPQSLFNEYFARGDVAFGQMATSYLSASYLDSIHEYRKRVEEVCAVVKKVAGWENPERALVYRMAYVNVMTALDAFICYVLLKRSIQDEALFNKLMNELAPGGKIEKWQNYIDDGNVGKWEQEAIELVLRTPFLDTERIDEAFAAVKFMRLEYDRKEMKHYYRIRHLLVHRSGRQKDDSEIDVTYEMLAKLINVSHTFVGAIFDSICITLHEESKKKPKERDLEEVFPGGVVRAPFKLSDLIRLLHREEEPQPFEPIALPVL